MNSLGICYLSADVMQIGEALETQAVLSHEEALAKLEKYLEEIIAPYHIEITKGYLMYVPIIDGQDYFRGKLVPYWCFESANASGGEYTASRTYAFNAFTGEELR